MSKEWSAPPLRFVVCSRCGAKVFLREVKTNHPESYPALMDYFQKTFVCLKCLEKTRR